MRTFTKYVVLLCLTMASITPFAGQDKEKDKADADYIRSMELKWTESYKQRQVSMLSSLLADDFLITIEDGSVYSKTGYISHCAEPGTHIDVAEMTDLKVRMHGNTAIIAGAYHEKGDTNGKGYEYHDRFT